MRDGDRFIGLDGLRGVAAIMVVLFHARLFAVHGYLAVDLFFIMSGFVIAASYESRLATRALGWRAYAGQRLWRLYPMLVLGGLCGLGFALAGLAPYRADDPADLSLAIVSQFTLIPFLSASTMLFPLNNPQWSIIWELAANFAHAAGLSRVGNRVLALIVLAAAAVLAWYALTWQTLSVGFDRAGLPAGVARAAFGFFAGVILHRTRSRWQPRVPQVHYAIPAVAFVVIATMPPSLVPSGPMFGAYDLVVTLFVLVPLVMLGTRARGGASAEALGHVSYPLYAISEPVVFWLALFSTAGQDVIAAAVAGLVVVSWALGRWVDAPLNAWRRQAMRRRSVGAGQASARPA